LRYVLSLRYQYVHECETTALYRKISFKEAMSVMKLEIILSILLRALYEFESVLRRLNPLAISRIRDEFFVHLSTLAAAQESLLAANQNAGNEHGGQELLHACELIMDAIKTFGKEENLQKAFMSVLRAARKHCQAQEALFGLCGIFPEVNQYFLEPGATPVLMPARNSRSCETGIFHFGYNHDPYARGGYVLYIPEIYTPQRSWPLIVALHGGYGHGRDFIWAWLREARSRGYVLLAPTSLGKTWSIVNVVVDGLPLNQHLEEVCSRLSIDRSRILLTGMSDGGTFALALGISPNYSYQSIATVSCTLPPVEMRYAKGKHIMWVHGTQDWMFPINRTVQACKDLSRSGADIKLKVVSDLSHAYPREENGTILKWFEDGNISSVIPGK
jgi:phospholipase/carboxylesterase